MPNSSLFATQKKITSAMWGKRSDWNAVTNEAYAFALPMRAAGSKGINSIMNDQLFDMTAPSSTIAFAGNLQRDLFPAGQAPFTLETGPMLSQAIGKQQTMQFNRQTDGISKRMFPFFQKGDWDTAVHETCLDLSIGTGALLPVKGTVNEPVIFASIPFDQIALRTNAWGQVTKVSWKQEFDYDALFEAFPQGKFSDGFRDKARKSNSGTCVVHQDFWKDPGGAGWHFGGWIDGEDGFFVHERMRTQPIAVPRYYRLNSHSYGFGPVVLALPSIKTLNKAQELALKAAAIQMLGIWGYRSGGTFNPDTNRIAPGEMWAMQSTGGIMGADISRLDAGGSLSASQLIIGNLQDNVREAMSDTRLPEYSGTPKAASEIMARMQQKADVHIGAFGRLVQEIMPVIVPRVAEILYEFGYLEMPFPIDALLLSVKVRSPMAAALNAERLASIAEYFEVVDALAGPDNRDLYANRDAALEQIAEGMQIDKEIIPTPDQRLKAEADKRKQAEQALAMQAVSATAQKAPELIGSALETAQ